LGIAVRRLAHPSSIAFCCCRCGQGCKVAVQQHLCATVSRSIFPIVAIELTWIYNSSQCSPCFRADAEVSNLVQQTDLCQTNCQSFAVRSSQPNACCHGLELPHWHISVSLNTNIWMTGSHPPRRTLRPRFKAGNNTSSCAKAPSKKTKCTIQLLLVLLRGIPHDLQNNMYKTKQHGPSLPSPPPTALGAAGTSR